MKLRRLVSPGSLEGPDDGGGQCHNTLLFITLSYESALNCQGREAIHRLHTRSQVSECDVHCNHVYKALAPRANARSIQIYTGAL